MSDVARIFVYDIETTPNLVWAWGLWDQSIAINQIVEHQDILCFAAHEIGTKGIETHASWDGKGLMLDRLHEIMSEADYLVGYNSTGFDDKLVRAQLVKAGYPPPAPFRSVDLLRVVKKEFRFPSHKLDYVCRALDLDVKVQTGGMDLWTQCMSGDEKARKKMLAYNRRDVKITTQLFERLRPWLGLNLPLYAPDDAEVVSSCTRCESTRIQSRGWAYTTTLRYRRYQCQSCGGWMKDRRSEPTPTELRNA